MLSFKIVVYLSYKPAIKNTKIHEAKIKAKGIKCSLYELQTGIPPFLMDKEIHKDKANMNKSPTNMRKVSFLFEIIMLIAILALFIKIETGQ